MQVKNGAIDFQPREPFHPLFGAMPKTPLMMEFQITKEYLGFATHLAYLGPLFEETLRARHLREGHGIDRREGASTARWTDIALTGIAGVANIGSDRDWTGSHLQPGQLVRVRPAGLGPDARRRTPIAREWAAQTFGTDPRVVDAGRRR